MDFKAGINALSDGSRNLTTLPDKGFLNLVPSQFEFLGVRSTISAYQAGQ